MVIISDDLLHYPEVLHYVVVKVRAVQTELEERFSELLTTATSTVETVSVKPFLALIPAVKDTVLFVLCLFISRLPTSDEV